MCARLLSTLVGFTKQVHGLLLIFVWSCHHHASISFRRAGSWPDQDLDKKCPFIDQIVPATKRSYNFAAYVNQSETLQQLIRLGVSLYDIESTNQDAARHILRLDFERDCAPYVKFLVDNGLKERNLGRFISEYPDIFKEPLDELTYRIDYYKFKKFSNRLITKAINRSAHILSHPVKNIDFKLGQFQIHFNLPANDLREIVAVYPQLIAHRKEQFTVVKFSLTEEFGFRRREIHKLLVAQPKLLGLTRYHHVTV